MALWKGSVSHHANLLSPYFEVAGVAVVISAGSNRPYWALEMAGYDDTSAVDSEGVVIPPTDVDNAQDPEHRLTLPAKEVQLEAGWNNLVYTGPCACSCNGARIDR